MQPNHPLRSVLAGYREGTITLDDAIREIEGLRIEAVGELARLDLGRAVRCGIPEVVLAEGKDSIQLADIAEKNVEMSGKSIISRISPAQLSALKPLGEKEGYSLKYHEKARMAVLTSGSSLNPPGNGIVAIITAGTSDIQVAEEARVIAGEMGCHVRTAYDVGAAGIHRLFPALRDCLDAHVFIVAAGREGTLPAVVAGIVDRPVIGVPVSTGYGYMGKGEAALASMLQSCSVLAVVNIDAGFIAGAFAARIANMVAEK